MGGTEPELGAQAVGIDAEPAGDRAGLVRVRRFFGLGGAVPGVIVEVCVEVVASLEVVVVIEVLGDGRLGDEDGGGWGRRR
ncbi:MAG: hypothetical protein AAGC55_20070 [Myxococcota bacterium]